MPPTAPRLKTVSQAAVAGFSRLVTKAECADTESIIKLIATHLRENPSEARPALVALENGLFGKALDKAKALFIPTTKCKLMDLSQKLLQHTIYEAQTKISPLIMKKLTKTNKDITHRLFYALFAESPNSPVFTREVEEFTHAYTKKFIGIGMQMKFIEISADDKVMWEKTGCYRFQAEGGSVTTIEHYSGKTVPGLSKPVLACSVVLQ
jgi:hypothetical protein